MPSGTSIAVAHSGRRGAPRSTSPTTFTKHSSASAAVAARPASASPAASATPTGGSSATCSSAWSVSHSEAKPFRGGRPAIAIEPTRNAPPVHGMRRSSPPSRSSSSAPTARSKAPAPRNSSALKIAWLATCSRAAANAIAAHSRAPARAKSSEAPSPRAMIPTFSIEWKASSRLRSCCTSAHSTPPSADSSPSASSVIPSQRGVAPSHSNSTRIRPYSATLIITPDIRADRCAGATGCARGSHECSGTSPALVPKPTRAATATSVCVPVPAAASAAGSPIAPCWARVSIAIHTPGAAEVRDGQIGEDGRAHRARRAARRGSPRPGRASSAPRSRGRSSRRGRPAVP